MLADRSPYRYAGSLPPPCPEGVAWLLLTRPIDLSPAQIVAFEAIIEFDKRPVRPLKKRAVLLEAAEDQAAEV